ARGMIVTLPHPRAGKVTAMGVPVRLHATPGKAATAPPVIGQHTDAVLRRLVGLGKPAVARLRAQGAVCPRPILDTASRASASSGALPMRRLIKIYDTTLRDGTQGEGVSFSMEDKVRLATRLDAMGIHYIEGGWPGSNPKDLRFFARMQDVALKHARLAAFSMTRRAGGTAEADANMRALR